MFTEQERKIFKYHNGVTEVWGDPLEINERLSALLGGKAKAIIEDSHSRDPDRKLPALELLKPAVCAAFELGEHFNPATGEGVLYSVWHAALECYLDFFWRCGGDTGTSSTAPLSSAPPHTSPAA